MSLVAEAEGHQAGVLRTLRRTRQRVELVSTAHELSEFDAAVGALASVLDAMPRGTDLANAIGHEHAHAKFAEGNTPRVQKLAHAREAIEPALNACLSMTASLDADAVHCAHAALLAAAERSGQPALTVVRGDAMSATHLGATAAAQFPNGRKLELSVRRAHPDHDTGVEAGTWLIEGGAWAGETEGLGSLPWVDHALNDEIDGDAVRVIDTHLATLITACAGNVVIFPGRASTA